jgi:hypothetical protein
MKLAKIIVPALLGATVSQGAFAATAIIDFSGAITTINAPSSLTNAPHPNLIDLALNNGAFQLLINIPDYQQYVTTAGGSLTGFTGTLHSLGDDGLANFGVYIRNNVLLTLEGSRFGMTIPNPNYDPSLPTGPTNAQTIRSDVPLLDSDGTLQGDLDLTVDRGQIVAIDYKISGAPLQGYVNRIRDLGVPDEFGITEIGFHIEGAWLLGDERLGDAFNLVLAPGGTQTAYITFTAAPVPVPAALPLFMSGVAAAGVIARRRKNAEQA